MSSSFEIRHLKKNSLDNKMYSFKINFRHIISLQYSKNTYMTSALMNYPLMDGLYRRLTKLGQGSYGKVYIGQKTGAMPSSNQNENSGNNNLSQSHQPLKNLGLIGGDYVALKKLKPYPRKKYNSPPIIHIQEFPQVMMMRRIKHENIIQLREIISFDKGYEKDHYLVIDFGIQLMELLKHKQILLSNQQIRCIVWQLASATDYLHKEGIMHRDIKPDNIYLMPDGTLKLGDFSISKIIHQPHKEQLEETSLQHTGNITTRHFRAPQIIYGSKSYDQSIDIWGFGCTIASLLIGQTIFPGTTDIHQLQLIFSIIGYPQLWSSASELPYYLQFDDTNKAHGLKHVLPNISEDLLNLIQSSLQLDPKKRIISSSILKHNYLKGEMESAKEALGKVCAYLYEKKLKQVLNKSK